MKKKFIAIAALVALLGGALPALAQFDYRATGTYTTTVLQLRGSALTPPLSPLGGGKLWLDSTCNCFKISENGGPWTQLSSFVGSGAVSSVFGRVGAIAAQTDDYGAFYAETATGNTFTGNQRVNGFLGIGADPLVPLHQTANSSGTLGALLGNTHALGYGVKIVGASDSTRYALTVNSNDDLRALFRVNGDGHIGVGVTDPANTFVMANSGVFAWKNAAGNGEVVGLSSGASNGLNLITGGTNRLVIDSSGNVGIGAAPGSNMRLDVVGFDYTTSPVIRAFGNGAAVSAVFSATAGAGGVGSASSRYAYSQYVANEAVPHIWAAGLYGTKDYKIHDATAVADRFTIDTSGNVGIGAAPTSKLYVRATTSEAGATTGLTLGTAATPAALGLGWLDSNYGWLQSFSSTPLYINPLGNNVVFNRDGGYVGIGGAPSAPLDVKAATSAPSITAQTGHLRLSTAAATGLNIGVDAGANGAWIQATNQPASGGGAFPLLLNPQGGNVGIGGTPTVKFDVQDTTNVYSRVFSNSVAGEAVTNIVAGNGVTSSRQAYVQYASNESVPHIWRTGFYGDKHFKIYNYTLGSTALRIDSTNNNADFSGAIYERGRGTPMGDRILVAYAASNFTASAGTWTVDSADQVTYEYTLVGKLMTLSFRIITTDVSSTPLELRFAIPGGFTAASAALNPVLFADAGTYAIGYAQVAANGTYVAVAKTAGNFTTTSGDNTHIIGQISFWIN